MIDGTDLTSRDFISTQGAQKRPAPAPLTEETQALFASQLQEVDAAKASQEKQMESQTVTQELLLPKTAAQGLPLQKEAAPEETKATQDSSAPSVARSWRMEAAEKATEVGEDTTLGWGDFLDLINPLQHLPVIGTLYREATGDEIKPEIQIAGNIILGAVTGSLVFSAVTGIASAIYEEHTGQEATIQVAETLFGDEVVGGPSPEAGNVDLSYPRAVASAAPIEKTAEAKDVAQKTETASLDVPKTKTARNIRVGKTLYPKSLTNNNVNRTAQSSQQEPQTAENTPLGIRMQEQAAAKAAGATLPPALVQDMMLLALDKYKAAQALTDETASIRVQ